MPNIEVPLTYTATEGGQPMRVIAVAVVNPDGTPIAGGGGGGTSEVTVMNWPTTQAVSGPLTNAQLTAISGAATAAAWDGTAASATMIAILKALHAQNAQIIGLLNDIKTNTTPAG